jgi:hypothetical protein
MKEHEISVEMLKMRNMMSILDWSIVSEEVTPEFIKVVVLKKIEDPLVEPLKE